MAVESGLFDTIGHADLCKKFGFYLDHDTTELFRPFLNSAKKAGVAMELNTAGLRKECREIYPSANIVRLAAELGVAITFGSDAHAPSEPGMDFHEAIELARNSGHTHWLRFAGRRSEPVSLPKP
jgi:histidinol-phosphatase (PHP family)